MEKSHLILSIAAIIIVAAVILFRFLPGKYIIGILGKDNAVSSLACSYPVKISGDSMEPDFKNGQIAYFNKCLEGEKIGVNTVILFSEGNINRIGIINGLADSSEGNIAYKAIQPNRPDRILNVARSQIIAVYKE